MQEQLLSELEYVMAGELELYVSLLEYAKRKKQALINNDVDELGILVKLEDEQLKKLNAFARKREGILGEIAAEDGFSGDVTIAYLEKKVPPAEFCGLERLSARYRDVIRELSALNAINQSLLQTQLQYTAFCMEAIMQVNPVGPMYASTGEVSHESVAGRRFIDQEA